MVGRELTLRGLEARLRPQESILGTLMSHWMVVSSLHMVQAGFPGKSLKDGEEPAEHLLGNALKIKGWEGAERVGLGRGQC